MFYEQNTQVLFLTKCHDSCCKASPCLPGRRELAENGSDPRAAIHESTEFPRYRKIRSLQPLVNYIHSKWGWGWGGVFYSEFVQNIWSVRPCTSFELGKHAVNRTYPPWRVYHRTCMVYHLTQDPGRCPLSEQCAVPHAWMLNAYCYSTSHRLQVNCTNSGLGVHIVTNYPVAWLWLILHIFL